MKKRILVLLSALALMFAFTSCDIVDDINKVKVDGSVIKLDEMVGHCDEMDDPDMYMTLSGELLEGKGADEKQVREWWEKGVRISQNKKEMKLVSFKLSDDDRIATIYKKFNGTDPVMLRNRLTDKKMAVVR